MKSELVTIKYDDLSLAFDFVSSAARMEHRAFVSLDTGKVYWVSALNPIEEERCVRRQGLSVSTQLVRERVVIFADDVAGQLAL